MTYKVEIRPSALKSIDKIDRQSRARVLRRIQALAEDPRPAGCEKLTNEDNLWRVRAGDYRVVYQILDDALLVTVVRVGHRSQVYQSR
ncbi:type II toxin-antitoxin system RelE/ParE family toxin [Micromonospora sp. NPDC004551]|uniref:type II toxin-antitoxin system RelE family toxin n=1 Tax=Micromonospora sp. NPDC004551 TaxID=3154284 RepID=UPI0033B18302